MKFPSLQISLPKWVEDFFTSEGLVCSGLNDRMDIAIELSRQNILHQTGGPFGAVIFDSDTGRLIAPGVNLVTSARCSNLHAEVVAISIAQKVTGSHDLSEAANCLLVTSSEPCAMCMGAIYWSGVKKIIYAARDEDVR
ncbi:MAG: nucleoside deaminase, partial [Anaerohalosphaera sp.]|nr:nucleoside deaminase [Anaerohalosphaera sp.]